MITVIGSLNMDLVIKAERAPQAGETLIADSFQEIPGGKGANQAVAAAREGAQTFMAGRVGQDAFGQSLLQSLAQDPIDITYIEKVPGLSTGIASITVDQAGQNRILVVSGANGSLEASDIQALRPLIARSHVLLLQLEIPMEAVEEALILAREEAVFSILNPAPALALPPSFYHLVNLMTPNESELAQLSGLPVSSREQVDQAGRQLLERGLENLVITLGQDGALAMNLQGKLHFPAYRVRVEDSTAAGDCFNGVLAAGIDRLIQARADGPKTFIHSLEDLAPIIDRASRAAALSVTRPGAQPSLPWAQEVDDFDSWYEKQGL